MKLLLTSCNINYPRKNLIYLKQVFTFQCNLIKFKNPKSSLPLKRFTVHNPNLNITKKELKKLFLFAKSQTHFILNSTFYNQIDGVAMGSPLAPVLANIFISFYESKWLNKYNLNKPNFDLRYSDAF